VPKWVWAVDVGAGGSKTGGGGADGWSRIHPVTCEVETNKLKVQLSKMCQNSRNIT